MWSNFVSNLSEIQQFVAELLIICKFSHFYPHFPCKKSRGGEMCKCKSWFQALQLKTQSLIYFWRGAVARGGRFSTSSRPKFPGEGKTSPSFLQFLQLFGEPSLMLRWFVFRSHIRAYFGTWYPLWLIDKSCEVLVQHGVSAVADRMVLLPAIIIIIHHFI